MTTGAIERLSLLAATPLLVGSLLIGSAAAGPDDDGVLVLRAIEAACPADTPQPVTAALAGSGAGEPQTGTVEFGLGLRGWRLALPLEDGGELRVSRLASGKSLQRVVVELDRPPGAGQASRPLLQARAERDCARIDARRLVYRGDGAVDAVELLDGKLQASGRRLMLDEAVPEGSDPGGVTVALLDTGVNYLQPAIGRTLARNPEGKGIGWDFEDDDARPFDHNAALSPFYPGRHGTMLANVLISESAKLRLIPLRFPRSRPDRLGEAVTLAATGGARVLLVGLGSRREADWQGFAAALAANPQLLAIISAGRDGEDIDDRAYYPAALALPNMVTVGAADGFGQPVRSNWGLRRVDVLAPAERLVVRNFDDVEETVAGAEFAAARVAAMATRLLEAEPDLSSAALKARILALARLSDHGGRVRSAYGAIPEEALAR